MEFPEYRRYESTRQEANNAMMALLAGSQLAAHTLQLTNGSTRLLPEIFPAVEHVSYFNLRTDAATQLLLDTGHHLGAVAVPYALAVHEDFVMTALDLLTAHGHVRRAPGQSSVTRNNRVSAWNMHEALWMTLGQSAPQHGALDCLEHFHLLRLMRNTQIHAGGSISTDLRSHAQSMSQSAEGSWLRIGRRTPASVVAGAQLRFTTFDIFAAFATTKALGRAINSLLRDSLTPNQWAQMCIQDYAAMSSKPRGSDQWMRCLVGHAAINYSAGGLTERDVVDAAVASGDWPAGKAVTPRRAARGSKRQRNRGTRPALP